ncbi:ABC transporter permease [Desulfobulbus rhabdoformis]|uniref:ABC transporter permease n=1 Tax=Desulfobulbus rhabdoformis TaxID=34032 RepID=UPI001964D7F4|nr:ABC transporter permease [Desulfobulbus rhabdoformis]MBM9615178.1 ABC transporter permease [Desulfobulbus rhabdoformis]
MDIVDQIRFVTTSIRAKRLHSFLTGLGIAVGIAAVILLTSMGEGLQRFVLAEFTQFGTNLIAINPGKVKTMGTSLGVIGSERLLTLEDADALRRLPGIEAAVPMVQGNAEVKAKNRTRRITVYGVGSDMDTAFQMRVQRGRFLPADDARAARAFVVLGHKVNQELFVGRNPLGERIQIGNQPARVIGVMESKGQILGFDMDDTVYMPASRALDLFNREGLMEIDILYRRGNDPEEMVAAIKRLLLARHGQEDFTITTQQQMLDVLGSVLGMLTVAVGALGGISLLVGSVGIFTVMTISVRERTGEIGLLRALGSTKGQVLLFFLLEGTLLAALGGFAGLVAGFLCANLIHLLVPLLPVHTPWSFVVLSELLSMGIGVVASLLPARQAALLSPLEALRSE